MPFDSHSIKTQSFSVPEIIPFFPLPSVVLFPHIFLPLHIFEPRYRDMVKDIASKGDCIGMALLKDGWEDHYYEGPPIHDLGCVGQLVNVEELTDGRYNIVLKGLQRCHYDELSVATPYRQATVTLLPESLDSLSLSEVARTKLVDVAESYLDMKKAHDLSQLIASEEFDDAVLVNSLSSGLDLTPLEKQFLLEAEHLAQRASRLTELLKFKLADLLSSAQG